MCIREIPSRRIDCFFSAKVYDNQGPIARGSYQPPSTALAKVAKYGSWARVKFIHCCGHCIHFVISVNDMPPSNLNIKRIVRIKCWERREANPHPQTSVSQVRRPHHYTTADITGSVLERYWECLEYKGVECGKEGSWWPARSPSSEQSSSITTNHEKNTSLKM